jgi:hypothetical protein
MAAIGMVGDGRLPTVAEAAARVVGGAYENVAVCPRAVGV